ncbi:hypothetical protein L218DRAFT_957524 [Marasmius fiardii PR-910]|nr:hypothetical protein L218DRAFT_957524 [Marasmius fiardii PR-910]
MFRELGISLLQDPSYYAPLELITSNIELRGSFSKEEAEQRLRLKRHPIYLFLHPIHRFPALEPMSCVSVHSWSSDKNGETCFSNDCCEHLGLPTEFVVMLAAAHKICWPTETYQTIHKWQVERGFDPYTTDFARYLGYQTYRAIQTELVELEEVDTGEFFSLSETHIRLSVPLFLR